MPVLALLAILLFPPLLGLDLRTQDSLTLALMFAIAAVGLDIFSGYGGQISIGNVGFVAIGAYASAYFAGVHGWNPWLTLPASIVVAGAVAIVLGIPMVRLGELGGAFVTFFFGFVVFVVVGMNALTPYTGAQAGVFVPALTLGSLSFTSGSALYYLAWTILAITALISVRYANCRSGKALRVIKRSPVVAASLGIRVQRTKLTAFVYSAMTAGAAGFVFGQVLAYISPENFPTMMSLMLFVMVIVGGLGSIAGPILGTVVMTLVVQATREAGDYRELAYAVILVLVLIFMPEGLYGELERWFSRMPWRQRKHASPSVQRTSVLAAGAGGESAGASLELSGVTVAFGGVRALNGAAFKVETGRIHALMGPNGAGKTTILNCITGLQRYAGSIRLDDVELNGKTPQQIRALGITRTFQNPSLVGDLTVLENVELGMFGEDPSGLLGDLLPTRSTLHRDRRARSAAEDALTLVGLAPALWNKRANGLSLAEQKLTDVARAIVARPRLVLLDEPSAGLHEDEIDRVRAAMQNINSSSGVSVVVIAHHVGFLRDVAHSATVLDFGRAIAQGSPDEVVEQERVIEVFLGVSHA
ncbi:MULTISPECIES: ABC transporter permease subunit [unclassified Aeromicrobium]|uniref:branched-chain amino acid ABC transporter ATP-binding protein/permease n=1 Tax=unclassified Aeromicrobium TaxID=2633570 RepID=UPI00396B08DA